MKLTLIGYWGAYPPANEATSAYLIEHDQYRLLIDCGSGAISQLQNYLQLTELDALIISHYHHDHRADIGCLQYSMFLQHIAGLRSATFPIYGNREDQAQFEALSYLNYTKGVGIDELQPIQIGPWRVSFCKTNHPVYCLAMRFDTGIHSFVYTADMHWSDEMVDFCQDCDVLLGECSVYDHQASIQSGHMTPELIGKLAQEANVKNLILTHLPQYGEHQELLSRAGQVYSGKISIASKGKVINFG